LKTDLNLRSYNNPSVKTQALLRLHFTNHQCFGNQRLRVSPGKMMV
jgi:hypothetical protein